MKKLIVALFLLVTVMGLLSFSASAETVSSANTSNQNSESLAESLKAPAPTGFKVKSKTGNSVTLTWDAVNDAYGYKIFIFNSENGEYELVKHFKGKTTYKVTGLEKATEYKFKIAFTSKVGEKGIRTNKLSDPLVVTTKSTIKNGWETKNGNKYYYVDDVLVKTCTKKIDGKLYLFGKTGKLLTSGTYSLKGNKYNVNADGVVTCNKWLNNKKSSGKIIYRYANSSGKITEYYFEGSDLYKNGVPTTIDDFSFLDGKSYFRGLCKLNKDYYFLYINSIFSYKVCDENNLSFDAWDTYYCETGEAIDFGSGKVIGKYFGCVNTNSNGIVTSAKLFNVNNQKYYTISGAGKSIKASTASPLIMLTSDVDINSADGVDWTTTFINNSNKDIKYITFYVNVKNAVNDNVKCEIRDVYSFWLKGTGPCGSGYASSFYWDAFMYNGTARSVAISSATIEYMDGTSKVLYPSDITYFY